MILKTLEFSRSIQIQLAIIYQGNRLDGILNRIDDIMVIVFVLSVVDRRFYSRSGLVIEWLLFNAKWSNFQLHHGENKLYFDKMMYNADDVHFVGF